jgi:hypothetical protein
LQLILAEASAAQHRRILFIGRKVLGANPEQKKGFHVRTIVLISTRP